MAAKAQSSASSSGTVFKTEFNGFSKSEVNIFIAKQRKQIAELESQADDLTRSLESSNVLAKRSSDSADRAEKLLKQLSDANEGLVRERAITADLEKELASAKNRIEELEAALASGGGAGAVATAAVASEPTATTIVEPVAVEDFGDLLATPGTGTSGEGVVFGFDDLTFSAPESTPDVGEQTSGEGTVFGFDDLAFEPSAGTTTATVLQPSNPSLVDYGDEIEAINPKAVDKGDGIAPTDPTAVDFGDAVSPIDFTAVDIGVDIKTDDDDSFRLKSFVGVNEEQRDSLRVQPRGNDDDFSDIFADFKI
ncbi:MAG: hypothetical protein LBN40_00275 [Oscillospiraceae bacterium]|jgi:hypothetical protein|nr:hypothetical protein [Oscillospiraceae bacterium]